MKRRYYCALITSIALSIVLSGCMPTYHPGITGSSFPAAVVPQKRDKITETWLSVDTGSSSAFNDYEDNRNTRIRVSRVRADRIVVVNTGIEVWDGTYTVHAVYDYRGDYRYYGVAPDINFLARGYIGSVGCGFGMYGALAAEFGDFRSFRRETEKKGLANNSTRTVNPYFRWYPWLEIPFPFKSRFSIIPAIGMPEMFHITCALRHGPFLVWLGWHPRTEDQWDKGYMAQRIGVSYRL